MKKYLGAVVSFGLFLVTGLIPSLVYGGYVGMILSNILFGPTSIILLRFMVGGGMILGLIATLFLYLVLGTLIYSAVMKSTEILGAKKLEHL